MKKFVALLLAVLMVASLCACGQKDTQTASDIKTVTAGKLTMSTNAQFPPYESVADDGKGYEGTGFEGIDIEIAYALAQKLGLELVVDDMDFDSALSAVQTGKSDIVAAGVTVTPERQNTMCFTDSYANGVQVVIVKEGSDIKSIDDLEGKQIGTQRGTTGYSYCIDDYGEDSVVPFDDGATAVQNLLAGKVDCVVIDKAPAQEYVKANAGLTILDTEYANDDTAIGILYTAKRMGYRVPEDLSICGFTNGERAIACDPMLTTVEQRGRAVGEEAARILIGQVEGTIPKDKVERRVIRTRLVLRGTTR